MIDFWSHPAYPMHSSLTADILSSMVARSSGVPPHLWEDVLLPKHSVEACHLNQVSRCEFVKTSGGMLYPVLVLHPKVNYTRCSSKHAELFLHNLQFFLYNLEAFFFIWHFFFLTKSLSFVCLYRESSLLLQR